MPTTTLDLYNKFKFITSLSYSAYYLSEDDLGKYIEIDTAYQNVEVVLPSNFQPGWWCNIVKENNNNVITFTSPLQFKSRGSVLTYSRSPVHVTFTDRNYWILIGKLMHA
jgi:hypothetical protein